MPSISAPTRRSGASRSAPVRTTSASGPRPAPATATRAAPRAPPPRAPAAPSSVAASAPLMTPPRRDAPLPWPSRTGARIVPSALVAATGTVIFGSQDARLYALDAEGHHRWSVELGGD